MLLQSCDKNIICLAKGFEFLRCNITYYPDRQSGTGERMSVDYLSRYFQCMSHPAYFILEQKTKGFHHFQIHFPGQATYIVVRFYRGRRTVHRNRFDDIRVDCPLRQPSDILNLMCFLVKYFNECPSYDLTLGLRVCNPLQPVSKHQGSINSDDIQPHSPVSLSLIHISEPTRR